MEQSVWVRQTGLFYQNVPGPKNRIVSGLTVGPNGCLMTVCGSVGGMSLDPTTGKSQKIVPEGALADEVRYDSGANNYYFSRGAANGGLGVVDAATEKFVTNIPLASHSVAANARNKHIFVPASGKGIFVVATRK